MSKTPYQDAQRAASAWIADELCAPRGWAAPPVGVPLCRMRLHASTGYVSAPAPRHNGKVDLRSEPRGNEMCASTTDPDARFRRKAAGQAAKLCHMQHMLMGNRHGLMMDTFLTKATGTVECDAVVAKSRCRQTTGVSPWAQTKAAFPRYARTPGVTLLMNQ